MSVLVGNCEKNLSEVGKPCYESLHWNFFFTPKTHQFSNNTPPVTCFSANTPKGTAKAPAVNSLMMNTLRGRKSAFLTPKSTASVHFKRRWILLACFVT